MTSCRLIPILVLTATSGPHHGVLFCMLVTRHFLNLPGGACTRLEGDARATNTCRLGCFEQRMIQSSELKLARLPPSLAATLAALPSISKTPFLDSWLPDKDHVDKIFVRS